MFDQLVHHLLKDHLDMTANLQLDESEKNGKSVESIVGSDPKQYIKSIGKTLPTDKKELFVLIPSTILVILAYLCYVPAIEGNFRVSQNILLWGSIIVRRL
ncbi:hypothetical protein [Streptomyces sp. NPDC046876]|uniref:hypothetical protein n=1 Tax=Streptomyces sp. NPDC046876 TaxID=3155616 RepID=UPI0033D7E5FD